MPNDAITIGDIYLVRFHPAVGSELKRYRPAVILSSQFTQIDQRFVLIAPLTSNITKQAKQYELLINNPSLDKPSLLLTWYLRTIDKNRLMSKIGQLDKTTITKMQKMVKKLFK